MIFFVIIFIHFMIKKNNKYLALTGTQIYGGGLHLFESMDGINWNGIKRILDESYLIQLWGHNNHFDTHNCIVYDDKEDNYFIYVRYNKPGQRFVQYSITKDFNEFTKCNSININDNNDMMLYTPGIFKYENYV